MNRRQRLVLIATILGSAAALLDGTVVNLALPRIGNDLQVHFATLQWIVDGYLLSLSGLILLGGSLGDILGRKKIYMIGIAGFGVTSLLCGLSLNGTMLISMRILQGICGALLTPGALAIITTNFPPSLRAQAIGRWTAFGSVATVAGPLVGGLILGATSWRWIFFINVPIVIACLLLGAQSIEETRDSQPRRIDWFGAGLASLALAGITYGLIEGPANRWPVRTVVGLALGVITSAWFVLFERRSRDPLVPLRLFKSRNFTGSNVMTLAMYGALGGFTFSLVIYLQTSLHYSSLAAGFSSLPVSLIMFFAAGRMGKLAGQYGPRLFLTVGPLLTALGFISLLPLRAGDSYMEHVFPGVVLFGFGLAGFVAPLTVTVMSSVSEQSSGIASGINNAVARIGGLLVVAALGLLGAGHEFHFAMILCASLASAAAVLSYLIIRNDKPND